VASQTRRLLLGFAISATGLLLAGAVGLLAGPRLGLHAPISLLILTVILSAAYGGLAPGLTATGLGALGAAEFVLPAGGDAWGPENRVGLALFMIVGVGLTLLGNLVRDARGRAEAAAASAARDRDLMLREMVHRRREEAAHRLLASIVESSDDAIYG
jgi:hypothetical protein